MNVGSTHIGTNAQSYALAAAQVADQARANWQQVQAMAAADRTNAQDQRAVQPSGKLVQTTAQIRDQVMAERGVDRLDLMRLPAQARLEAEISIAVEAADRAREANTQPRPTGLVLDIRV